MNKSYQCCCLLLRHAVCLPGAVQIIIPRTARCLLQNGSVVSTDVEDFDTAAYKQDDLQSYVDKSIDDYNKKNDGSIKLKKLTVEKRRHLLP